MRTSSALGIAFTLALAIGSVACSKSEAKTRGGAVVASSDEAQQIFNSRCVTCHGQDGTGKGPGAAALNPKPRNYTDKAWQASVTDEQIKKTIVGGGASVGKSPLMPPNPDLESKPQVVDDLVKIVRGFGG